MRLRLSIVNPRYPDHSHVPWKLIRRNMSLEDLQTEIDRLPSGTRILVQNYGDWTVYDIQQDRTLKQVNGGGRTLRLDEQRKILRMRRIR